MKRWWALLLAALLALPIGAPAEKAAAFPAAFRVKYQVKEREIRNGRRFVSKDQITAALPQVSDEINALANAFDEQLSPGMTPDPGKNPRRNSRLDIHIVHTVSGESCVSFLVLARESYQRKQKQSPFAARVYDMESGRQVALGDLFDPDSEAWDVLAEAVMEELSAYFPQEEADPQKLKALCAREALEQTPFMLGPVCLSLHYQASALYPDHPTLMRVTVPYAALRDMMTDYGRRQTDNQNYNMVALTFDDGPSYTNTAVLLNNLRKAGAQATFFLVGDRVEEYPDIVMRENDEIHSLQSHSYKHVKPTTTPVARLQEYTEKMNGILSSLVGTPPAMLRAPYGEFDPFIEAEVNLPLIHWGVDTKDWTGRSAAAVLKVIREEAQDGSIILMHDIEDNTPATVREVTDWLYEHGFLCVTVEDLFLHNRQPFQPNQIYYRINPNTDDF